MLCIRRDRRTWLKTIVLFVCCKTLEHIVYSNICKFLVSNNILTSKQHGFRPGFSCKTQLILSIDDWARSLDSGFRTDVAIFDFSKAFDSVPHTRLLGSCISMIFAVKCLPGFLLSHSTVIPQRFVVHRSQPSWSDVISGVPQGTVLGPLLFLLYINGITGNIQSNIRLFADDCIVYRTIRSHDDSCKLQNDISSLLRWAETWQMRFNNCKKCHILSISRQRHKSSPVYYIGTDVLSTVSSHTYLGITVSSDLKWHEHISNMCLKATRFSTLLGVIHIVVLRKLKILIMCP